MASLLQLHQTSYWASIRGNPEKSSCIAFLFSWYTRRKQMVCPLIKVRLIKCTEDQIICIADAHDFVPMNRQGSNVACCILQKFIFWIGWWWWNWVALRCYGVVSEAWKRWWMAILALCQILGVALKAGKGWCVNVLAGSWQSLVAQCVKNLNLWI